MATKSATTATTIDQYLDAVTEAQRPSLQKLREAIHSAAPKAEECISYRLAAFRLNGKPLVAFGATANHCAFYLMSASTLEAHKDDLAKWAGPKGYDTSKGTIRFQADKPLPAALVRKLVKARIAENADAASARRSAASERERPAAKQRDSKPRVAQTDPEVAAYLRDLKHPLKAELEALRKLILSVSPTVREGYKWNSPSFRTSDYFATINVHGKDGLRLILHNGAKAKATAKTGLRIPDPKGLLTWLGKDRCLVSVRDAKDLRAKGPPLRTILREWIAQI